jgi:hypothetical protein
MELKHYPKEVCPACHKAGGGVERRDLFLRADQAPEKSQERQAKIEKVLKDLKELLDEQSQ